MYVARVAHCSGYKSIALGVMKFKARILYSRSIVDRLASVSISISTLHPIVNFICQCLIPFFFSSIAFWCVWAIWDACSMYICSVSIWVFQLAFFKSMPFPCRRRRLLLLLLLLLFAVPVCCDGFNHYQLVHWYVLRKYTTAKWVMGKVAHKLNLLRELCVPFSIFLSVCVSFSLFFFCFYFFPCVTY